MSYRLPNDPSFNKDWSIIKHWFGDKRHFRPFYDDDADYNTNAKSYYDFLARFIRQLDTMISLINALMARDIEVTDTSSIDLTKKGDWQNGEIVNGEWQGDLIENLSAVVKLSAKALNAIHIENDGLWAKDFQGDIDNINNEISNIWSVINQILDSIASTGEIEVPRDIYPIGNNKLINSVNLGEIKGATRIGITWHQGSTRATNYYYAKDLRGNNAHISGFNMTDTGHEKIEFETFTKIHDDNKLWITTVHVGRVNAQGEYLWIGAPFLGAYGDPEQIVYYDEQNPDYINQTNGQDQGIYVDQITVYDLKPIIAKQSLEVKE